MKTWKRMLLICSALMLFGAIQASVPVSAGSNDCKVTVEFWNYRYDAPAHFQFYLREAESSVEVIALEVTCTAVGDGEHVWIADGVSLPYGKYLVYASEENAWNDHVEFELDLDTEECHIYVDLNEGFGGWEGYLEASYSK